MINPDDIKAGMTLGHADAELLRAAVIELARRDTLKPVAYTDVAELRFEFSMADMWKEPIGHGRDVALFTAAPAPVVSPEWVFEDGMKFAKMHGFPDPATVSTLAWNACRAAMKRGEL